MLPLVQYSDVIFRAEPEYKEIYRHSPVGFKAVDTSYPFDLSGFKVFGQKVSEQAPDARKYFWSCVIPSLPITICWQPYFILKGTLEAYRHLRYCP